MKILIQFLFFFIPWSIRRIALNRIFGFDISAKSKIGFSLLLCDELVLSADSRIGHLVFCKNIDRLFLHESATIGSLNFITGFNTNSTNEYKHRVLRKCELILGEHSAITSRHFIDCNGGVYIGKYSTIAGIRSIFMSHSIDIYNNRQDAECIVIGDFCFIGSNVTVLKGVKIASNVVLAAGSVVSASLDKPFSLYGGVPSRWIKDLPLEKVKYFQRKIGFVK
jgi:acetyltransferase-like isoleucine patch superfamily enzyme